MTRTTFAERLSQLRTRHIALGASLLLLVGASATFIGTRPLDKACQGQAVTPADDLVELVNGTSDATFCLSPGLYNLGNNTLRPGDRDQVIGAPVTVAPNGAIQAATKIFGTGTAIIDLATANGVLLENLDVSGATGNGPGGEDGRNSGVGIVHGKNTTLLNLVSHDNANAGVKAFSGQVHNIELYANGSKPYTGVTAAGIKSARSFEVSSSFVHDNLGVGVWADIHAESLVVSESVVVGNELAGVRWEHDKDNVGGSAIVARNILQKNKGGGVAIDSASSADVTGNLFGANTDAVTIEEDKNPVAGIAIYGNILGPEGDASIQPDQLNVCDDTTVVCYNNAETGTLPSPEPSISPLPSPSPEPSVTPEPSPSPNPSPTPDPSPSPEPTPSPNPSPSPQPSPSPSPNPPVQGGVVIAAAGDLCKPDGVDCKKTSDLIAQDPSIDAVLTLGDNQYENGELSNFQSAFDPAWGRFKDILHPSPGNHDLYNSGYKDYFNVPQRYSFNLGNWHLVSLDSNEVSGSASFLSSDLAKDNHTCEIAYWHHARFSSGANHGSDQSVAPLWDIMYKNGVDVNLVGHDHIYERFEPQTPDAKPDPNGVQQFTVGTGGDDLRGVGSVVANSTKREANVYGIIKMKLGANDYSWEFVTVGGQVLDSGSGTCHGAAGP